MKTKILIALSSPALMLFCISAFCNNLPETQWTISSPGTVSWAGGTSALTGTGIGISSVEGISTPSNPNIILPISGGDFEFTSGTYSGSGWNWGKGGTLSIKGTVTLPNSTKITGTLLSDDFQSASVSNGGWLQITLGNVEGTVNPNLAQYLGLGGNTAFSASAFDIVLSGGILSTGQAFSAPVLSGQIDALADPVSASEPWGLSSSLIFFTLALGVFGALVHKRVLHVTLTA